MSTNQVPRKGKERMNFYQKTSTKKSLVKEDEVRREARVEQSVFPPNHITMTLPPSDQSPAAVALKSASVSGVSQKRKSSTVVTKTGFVAAKFPKIPDRKKKFVSTVLYEVSRPCQDIRGKTFAVYPGERVKFIRYCKGGVEVMNQFEVSGVIPEDAVDPTKVPRFCPCRNVHIFKFLVMEVMEPVMDPQPPGNHFRMLTSLWVPKGGGTVQGHQLGKYFIKVLAKYILTIQCLSLLLNIEFVARLWWGTQPKVSWDTND